MSEPFIGQIQPFGFGFAPRGWAQCNGQLLAIAQNTALFSLLGTMYGGNGISNFALPNLQSRVPMHVGTVQGEAFFQGEQGGSEQVTLNITTMPSHSHTFFGTADSATRGTPTDGSVLATIAQGGATGDPYYTENAVQQPINPESISSTGGNQPHNNLQPYLTINWCIALVGIYPSRA